MLNRKNVLDSYCVFCVTGYRRGVLDFIFQRAKPMMRRKVGYYILFLLLVSISGCASTKESIKGFMGVSTKVLEDGRRDAVVKNINYNYFNCYTKTLDVLKQIGAYMYSKDIKKHMIAIYVTEEDTTPVGIFFKEIDEANTQIEISSPSIYAKEKISQSLFSALEESMNHTK